MRTWPAFSCIPPIGTWWDRHDVLRALAVDLSRAGPALGRAEHDHRPAGTFGEALPMRARLDPPDLADGGVERGRHQFVHLLWLMSLDEIRRISIASQQVIEFLVADAGEDRGIGDLVAVEVKDRQNDAVGQRIQKFVRVPTRRQRSCLRLAIPDDASDDQVGVVESGAVGVREGIAEFASLVHRARRLRRHVAGNSTGKRELRKEALHARFVLRDVRIDFAIGSFEIGVRDKTGSTVPRARDVDRSALRSCILMSRFRCA